MSSFPCTVLRPLAALRRTRNGRQVRLKGTAGVAAEKLNQAPGKELRTMMSRGELRAIDAHLMSLENFTRLRDLHAARPG